MSADADALDRLVVTIVSVRRRLGARAYRAALLEARRAVAALVLREAERRAGTAGYVPPEGKVVSLAGKVGSRRGRKRDDGQT